MPVLRPVTPAHRGKVDTERLAELAGRQSGVVSRAQLESVGVSDSAMSRWVQSHRLHRIHPGVYAVGHAALSLDGRLIAALLYGGDDAVFSHTTAAWLWRLIDAEPKRISSHRPGPPLFIAGCSSSSLPRCGQGNLSRAASDLSGSDPGRSCGNALVSRTSPSSRRSGLPRSALDSRGQIRAEAGPTRVTASSAGPAPAPPPARSHTEHPRGAVPGTVSCDGAAAARDQCGYRPDEGRCTVATTWARRRT